MFSAISLNWAGQPLRSFALLLGYLRGTTTTSGLTIKASLVEKVYAAGQRVSDQEMQQLHLDPHTICPKWNYTIVPRRVRQTNTEQVC
jgi:Rhodopirellula transposase DDE domain